MQNFNQTGRGRWEAARGDATVITSLTHSFLLNREDEDTVLAAKNLLLEQVRILV